MTVRYAVYLSTCALLGVLLVTVGGYDFLHDWEPYVLSIPLLVAGTQLV